MWVTKGQRSEVQWFDQKENSTGGLWPAKSIGQRKLWQGTLQPPQTYRVHFSLATHLFSNVLPKVLLVRQKSSGQLFALKILKKADVYKRNQIAHTNTEKNILSALQHPFIVKMYSSFQTDEKLYMCLEYVQGGELFVHLRRYHLNNCVASCKLPLSLSTLCFPWNQVSLLPGTCGQVLRRGSDSGSGLSSPTRCGLQRLKGKQKISEDDVTWTRNLLIWSQTLYHLSYAPLILK